MRSECFIQRYKTVIYICNGSALKFPTRFPRHNSRLTYHCILTITSVGVILCNKRILLERGRPASIYVEIIKYSKQLMHTFLHFVVCLQNIFYTLGLIFVFDVNIYSHSLRFFKIDPVENLLAAAIRQYFILALSSPLRWLRVTFVLNTLIALKELFFRPVT